MNNKANIYYDSEIEEIVRSRSLGVLPMLEHMFAYYPDANHNDIYYTVADHVQKFGIGSNPETLLSAPSFEDESLMNDLEEELSEPTAEEPEVEVPIEEEPNLEDKPSVQEKEEELEESRSLNLRPTETPRQNMNVRRIMADIDDLGL